VTCFCTLCKPQSQAHRKLCPDSKHLITFTPTRSPHHQDTKRHSYHLAATTSNNTLAQEEGAGVNTHLEQGSSELNHSQELPSNYPLLGRDTSETLHHTGTRVFTAVHVMHNRYNHGRALLPLYKYPFHLPLPKMAAEGGSRSRAVSFANPIFSKHLFLISLTLNLHLQVSF
jgi:hypothetical protein